MTKVYFQKRLKMEIIASTIIFPKIQAKHERYAEKDLLMTHNQQRRKKEAVEI